MEKLVLFVLRKVSGISGYYLVEPVNLENMLMFSIGLAKNVLKIILYQLIANALHVPKEVSMTIKLFCVFIVLIILFMILLIGNVLIKRKYKKSVQKCNVPSSELLIVISLTTVHVLHKSHIMIQYNAFPVHPLLFGILNL